jgi:hypothetical protein
MMHMHTFPCVLHTIKNGLCREPLPATFHDDWSPCPSPVFLRYYSADFRKVKDKGHQLPHFNGSKYTHTHTALSVYSDALYSLLGGTTIPGPLVVEVL